MRCAWARQMQFAPGAILVFDRGYTDYQWFTNLTQQAGLFCDAVEGNAITECWRSVTVSTAARGLAG